MTDANSRANNNTDAKPNPASHQPEIKPVDSSVKIYNPNNPNKSDKSIQDDPSIGSSPPQMSSSHPLDTVQANSSQVNSGQAKPALIPKGMPTIRQNHKQTHRADKQPFKLSYLLPQYWGIWLLLVLIYPLIYLPLRYQFWVGKRLGLIAYQLARRRRNITLTNLKLAFPEKMQQEQSRMAKQVFVNQGIGLFETLCAWYRPDVFTRTISISGLQHVVSAQMQGQPVILLGAHYTVFDLSLRLLTQFFPIEGIYEANPNPLLAWFMNTGRRHIIDKTISPNDWPTLTDAITQNAITQKKVIWYAADPFNTQDKTHSHVHNQAYSQCHDNTQDRAQKIIAPFFGVPALTTVLPRQLGQLPHFGDTTTTSQSPAILLLHAYRQTPDKLSKGRRPHYHLTITPALQNYPSTDEVADATRINEALEGLIRIDPTQWMWFRDCYTHSEK